ncbi:hypothetical protein [Thiomicrorhabdus aquaedulcis]|uniref:hypothetical protein n=1 Tax=Thiomicrorhabdus aquaedulcis TaxID=2211106 RepID=UPI000FDCB9CD|nr:hypothetical protein [Thiomicrorhabdus aquaedulcis]
MTVNVTENCFKIEALFTQEQMAKMALEILDRVDGAVVLTFREGDTYSEAKVMPSMQDAMHCVMTTLVELSRKDMDLEGFLFAHDNIPQMKEPAEFNHSSACEILMRHGYGFSVTPIAKGGFV